MTSWVTEVIPASAGSYSDFSSEGRMRVVVKAVVGDLWVGNAKFTPVVTPIDPAQYNSTIAGAFLLSEGETYDFHVDANENVYFATALASGKGILSYQTQAV